MRKIPVVFFLLMSVILFQCTDDKKATELSASSSKPAAQSGEDLAKIYCASCHLYPTPDLLDKDTWSNVVLIRMGAFMGIYQNSDGTGYTNTISDEWLEPGLGGKRVKEAKVYPNQAAVTIPEWKKIADFYIDNSPDKLPKAEKNPITVGIPFFNSERFNQEKNLVPLVQSMAVDEKRKVIYAAEYNGGIYQFDYTGKELGEFKTKKHIVEMKATKDAFLFLDMASRYASDNPKGAFYEADSFEELAKRKYKRRGKELMRPVDFSIGDLNGDQREDVVISEYGNLLGALSWLEKRESGSYERHEIFSDDGAIKSEITDLNGDGKNDIIALKGNSDEGIDWYLNDGNGTFKRERKLRFPPTNGSTHFQLIDFNKDGVKDLLYSNGDNGDYAPIMKPYHGIHLFINKNDDYQEEFFIPLNGVYQAEAVDFDLDGDLDIAAVSFHPDFENDQKESFVVFVNNGNNDFTPYTIAQFANSRWMRFITTDIDGDKDVDILLSGMNIKTPEVPQAIADKWKTENEAIMLLENKSR